jgi:hypothetical protein
MCCANGKVRLEPLSEQLPPFLRNLLFGENSDSEHFLSNIREYNSCFQLTSFGADSIVQEAGFMPTFKVQGQVYHRTGSLLPLSGEEPKFLQIYFMGDQRQQAERRCQIAQGVRANFVLELQEILHEHNRYVREFKTAMERLPQETEELRVVIRADKDLLDNTKDSTTLQLLTKLPSRLLGSNLRGVTLSCSCEAINFNECLRHTEPTMHCSIRSSSGKGRTVTILKSDRLTSELAIRQPHGRCLRWTFTRTD